MVAVSTTAMQPESSIVTNSCKSLHAGIWYTYWNIRREGTAILTTVYFIRHAESIYTDGNERERGLTDKGKRDALRVRDLLADRPIEAVVSSPYRRAIDTVRPLADALGKPVAIEEHLRERLASGTSFGKDEFMQAKKKLFEQPDFSFPGGESSEAAGLRAVRILAGLLREYEGRTIAIGTHGDIMTLMLNRYDPGFGYPFWTSLTMPDIYRLEFDREGKLRQTTRLWPE
ncbi:histidine phosphatase family protein [Paenibacillus sp. GYB003]|uniref:histidine phosphatase family protein n=1 Tax=Paenibacillus sp. GYB003 TaxID=2994392 RepID=UPI002F96854C